MALNLSNENPIISRDILVKYAVKFSLGADILKLGERKFEKELGAENESGNKVYFEAVDGGSIQEGNLDLSNATGGDARRVKKRALTLDSITAYFTMGQEDLDLLIQEGTFGEKCTARAIEKVQVKAFDLLKGVASAQACDNVAGIIDAFMGAEAMLEASKMDGELCGMANVWNDKEISSAYAKAGIQNHGLFKASQQTGLDAGAGFAGFKWSKATAGQNVRITGLDYSRVTVSALGGVLDDSGSVVISNMTLSNHPSQPSTGTARVDSPFQVAGMNIVDELGEDTNVPMSFTGSINANGVLTLDKEVRFPVCAINANKVATGTVIDPLANCTLPVASITGTEVAINAGVVTITPSTALTTTGVLTANSVYYQPVLLWKKSEFLVAVKGLKPLKATDSATIPASFGGEKGIIPWRGTAWSVEEKSQHKMRFDAYFGFGYFKGIAVRSIYIKVGANAS